MENEKKPRGRPKKYAGTGHALPNLCERQNFNKRLMYRAIARLDGTEYWQYFIRHNGKLHESVLYELGGIDDDELFWVVVIIVSAAIQRNPKLTTKQMQEIARNMKNKQNNVCV